MSISTLRGEVGHLHAEIQGSWCQGCLRSDKRLLVHHIKALADGGDNTPSNLAVLCYSCHRLLHLFLRGIPNMGGERVAASIKRGRRRQVTPA